MSDGYRQDLSREHRRGDLEPDQRVIYDARAPVTPMGVVVGLTGNLAPDGAIVKVAGMNRLQFQGPALVFE
jgi:dihydroxy-acid dehydratase